MYIALALIPGSNEENRWSELKGKDKKFTNLSGPASVPLSSKIQCLLFFILSVRSKLFYLFLRYG